MRMRTETVRRANPARAVPPSVRFSGFFGFSGSFELPKKIPGPILRSSFRCRRFEWYIDILPDTFTVTAFRISVPILSRKIEYSQG